MRYTTLMVEGQFIEAPEIQKNVTPTEAHASLVDKFKTAGIETEGSFPQDPYTPSYYIQLRQEISAGREPDKDLLAKEYFEEIVSNAIAKLISDPKRNTYQMNLYARYVASQFSIADIQSIHEKIVAGDGIEYGKFNEELAGKGLHSLPTTVEQLQNEVKDAYALAA
jgi:hypothetical protein